MISLEIGGRMYALDLWWQVREGASPGPRKAMLALAREKAGPEAYDCVVIRRHQFGLGHGKEHIGQPSLAAAMRPTAMTFLGMFCLRRESPEQEALWWVCAIRQGSIAGDGDMIFHSRKDARQKVRHLLDLLGKCDMELTCESPEESLAAITPLLRPEARVEDLFPAPKGKKYGLMALGAGLIVAGIWTAKYMWEARRLELEQSAIWELATRKQARIHYLREHPEEIFPLPERRIFLTGCLEDIVAFPAFVQGWEVVQALCDPAALTVTFQHGVGASFQTLPPLAALQDKTTALASYPRQVSGRNTAKLTPLLTEEEILRHLYQVAQDTGLLVRHSWQERASHALDKENVVQSPWREGLVEIEIPDQALSPQLAELLENMPGFRLESVKAMPAANWLIKGVIHARYIAQAFSAPGF